MDAALAPTLTHTVYTWIEQLLVPAALALASWQVLRRSARRPALRRALLVRPLQALAARGGNRPLGAWAAQRLEMLATASTAAGRAGTSCASGCGSCGGCAPPGPTAGAAGKAAAGAPQPIRWLGRVEREPRA